ncbi:uncharacterized protein LOC134762973 [Penaeus indicus]|uniref:uncharacterized protein LOC134762973 n=1 Tax=Penaeus indicus TaxID=29960 RepID=UPI00300C33AF
MTGPGWRAFPAALLCFCFVASVCAEDQSAGRREASLGGLPLTLDQPFVYENGEKCGADTGCLTYTSIGERAGEDALGAFYEAAEWTRTQAGTTVIFASRTYGDGTQVFKQEFPDGLKGTSTGNKDLVSTAYPRVVLSAAPDLRFVTPGGYMAGWTLLAQGSTRSDLARFRDGEDGGVVVLYRASDSNATDSAVLSALSNAMAVSVSLDPEASRLDWGVQGLAEEIPPGFSLEVILHPQSQSVVRNIMSWGMALKKYHSTVKIPDPTAEYLSYYTDNGAYHYYNPLPFANFRDAVLDVYNHSVQNDVPIRYLQLDSWWYHKGEGGGVKNWTEIPYIIPDGIGNLYETTGWPIIAHNRYFSSDTDYARQNGGLCCCALHTEVDLAGKWLDQMGGAALERGVSVQYCMSLTRHLLYSVTLPAVTQIRVSDDYMLSPDQWRIGVTNLLAYALGLKPFKDVFWSSKENANNFFKDCDLALPESIWHPLALRHRYGGRINVTASGKACVAWADFGWDDKYYGSGMALNLCRNPEDLRDRPFCYTKAGFDIPEEEWEWEYCAAPVCDVDCYFGNGAFYIGGHNVTQSGLSCVDWAGEFDLSGARCRNPDGDVAPWCFVAEDHSQRDYCDNECPEAVEYSPELQSAVSTLAGGPLGVGDKAQNLNVELIMKSCNKEGLLLHPTKPATVIDLYFMSPEYREVWTGYSTVGEYTFGFIFLAEVEKPLSLSSFDLNLDEAFRSDVLLWQNYPEGSSHQQLVGAGEGVLLPPCGGFLNFCLFYTSPAINAGGKDLFIPLSLSFVARKFSVVQDNFFIYSFPPQPLPTSLGKRVAQAPRRMARAQSSLRRERSPCRLAAVLLGGGGARCARRRLGSEQKTALDFKDGAAELRLSRALWKSLRVVVFDGAVLQACELHDDGALTRVTSVTSSGVRRCCVTSMRVT